MSRLRPNDSQSNQYRNLSQPHIVARSLSDPRWSVPVRYVRDNKRTVLLPLLAFFTVCLITLLIAITQNKEAIRQSQGDGHVTAKAVAVVSQTIANTKRAIAGLAEKQDTSDAKLATLDDQVQNLKRRVARHDRIIRDLNGRASLPRDYNPSIPLADGARIHHISPTVTDWLVDVNAKSGGKGRLEVAPVRLTPKGTEVYVVKGNAAIPAEAGTYYLLDSQRRLTKSR